MMWEKPMLPWGKHEGQYLEEVPTPYLQFVASSQRLRPALREAILEVLAERGLPFGRHKGTPIRDLPDGYLAWLARTELQEPWPELLRAELDRRGL